MNDEEYMQLALQEAQKAAELGEIPIGAVVVAERPELQEYSRIPKDEQRALLARYARLAGFQGDFDPAELPSKLVVARAHNRREVDKDPSGHAEFAAITQASKVLGAWRLYNCTVYVTLEPCLMCAGLMYQARVKRCVFGAYDSKAGAVGSLYRVHEDDRLNHVFPATGGVCEEQCVKVMKDFFAMRRAQAKERKKQARAMEAALEENAKGDK